MCLEDRDLDYNIMYMCTLCCSLELFEFLHVVFLLQAFILSLFFHIDSLVVQCPDVDLHLLHNPDVNLWISSSSYISLFYSLYANSLFQTITRSCYHHPVRFYSSLSMPGWIIQIMTNQLVVFCIKVKIFTLI